MPSLLLHWRSRTPRSFLDRVSVVLLTLALQPCSTLLAQDHLLPVLHFQRLVMPSSNSVSSRIVRDSLGFVWVGGVNGLERYDGYGFKEYRNIADDPHSLSSSRIHSLLVDTKGRLWVGTTQTGLSLYDRARDRFINFYPYPEDSSPYERRTVYSMMEDHSGNLWLATSPAGVVRVEVPAMTGSSDLDSLARGLHFRRIPLGTPLNKAYDLFEGKDGRILVGSDSGLIILDPVTYALSRPHFTDPLGGRLDSLCVRCILRESDGNIWVGTATHGLFQVEWDTRKVANYRHREGDSLSIKVDDIWDIVEDRRGNLWIGTIKGLDLFSPVAGHCIPYLTFGGIPGGTARIRLSFDRTGTFWVGTEANVYWLSPRSQLFPHFSLRDPDGTPRTFDAIERSLDGNLWCFSVGMLYQIDITTRRIMKSIDVSGGRKPLIIFPSRTRSLLDKRGTFWYAAYDLGLYSVNLASGRIKNYTYESPSGSVNRVRSIVQGSGDSLWIGAVEHGLMKFDPGSGEFLRTRFAYAADVTKDHDGRIWLATEGDGLDMFDPATGTTSHFAHDPSDPRSLSSNPTWSTYEDPSGRIWVGAGNVMNRWDPATRSFTRYPNPAFNDAATAHSLGSDRKGRLWVWYDGGGLSILDPSSGEFTSFGPSNGVCGGVLDMESLDDGRVLLAGLAGVNIVSPDSIDTRRPPPPLVITRMAINDEPVPPAPLLHGSGSLRLSHTQDVVEFEFAATDIDAPQLVQYRYQLEGLEKEWVKPKDRRYVRYTALPPGEYVFRVKATMSRGEWPDQEIALALSIAPPWWRTTWAYAAYVFLFVGLLYGGYRVRLRQVHLQQEVEMEHFQREHLAEVDRLKSRFFANISHEFRTPLTLILGPILKWKEQSHSEERSDEESEQLAKEQILPLRFAQGQNDKSRRELHNDMSMAERNAHRLLRLINQLLDLSKVEAGAMKLRASRMNIVPLVKGIAYSFESSAGIRGVDLDVHAEQEEIGVYCDKDMMEKILSNLLSNAFKFTTEGGRVQVQVSPSPPRPLTKLHEGERGRVGEWVTIAISDTGIGIPADQLDKVFDRFYQVDASQTREHEGSGLGLALVKELVELHHGTIQVESQVGKGTTFTVRLPLGRGHLKDDEIVDVPVAVEPTMREAEGAPTDRAVEGPKEEVESEQSRREKPIVLVVEDNADVRAYIKGYLVPAYQMTEARDGAEGIEKAQEGIPDLIISDVMMPKKDGYEVCRTLKLDEKTSHIPIILLTAKAASENKIEGLETGADDYLIKPFEPKELLARVGNLIDLRRKLRERFSRAVPLKPGEIAVSSLDDVFLRKVMSVVEQHIGDDKFGVEELCREVCMSRVQLHRKLTGLTNQSAGEFIRYIRLHRAMDLLKKNAGTVAEVAYSVGYSDPSHFSTRFREQFGLTPSDVRKNSGGAATGP
jgi:signal transduction histidine kinase/ligand-binding sensor domain-containing protein/AraC-like DNA-binding protein